MCLRHLPATTPPTPLSFEGTSVYCVYLETVRQLYVGAPKDKDLGSDPGMLIGCQEKKIR